MSQTPSGSGRNPTAPNVDEANPLKLSGYMVDPTAAYENKPDWKSTLHASAGPATDVFTPLKSVARGLSAILKHYDVRCVYFAKYFIPLTLT